MSKEIVMAGVRYNNIVYDGFNHGECFKKLREDNPFEETTFTKIVHSEIEQGFVDNDGNFVDRKQAMLIAKESGQLSYETDKQTLISEDLHLDWLNKQADRIAELKEQLKNAIVLPMPLNEKCWNINSWVNRDMKTEYSLHENTISNYEIRTCMINNKATLQVIPHCLINYIGNTLYVFATEEEAKAKLEELTAKNV